MPRPDPDKLARDVLAEFDRAREELLLRKRATDWSGRIVMYLDLKRGRVVEGGEVNVVEPWTGGG